MSGFEIKMNPGWEKALQGEIQRGVGQIAADWTKKLERFHRRYSGHSVETIKPALARLFRREGINASNADLAYYADQIHKGR